MFPNIFVNTCDTQAQNLATYSSRSISHLLTKVNRILHNISTFYHSLTLQTSRNGKGDYLDILIILHRKSHDCICNRDWVGGAGEVIVEHCSVQVLSVLKASSISSNGMSSMLTGFLLALIISVKWSS